MVEEHNSRTDIIALARQCGRVKHIKIQGRTLETATREQATRETWSTVDIEFETAEQENEFVRLDMEARDRREPDPRKFRIWK